MATKPEPKFDPKPDAGLDLGPKGPEPGPFDPEHGPKDAPKDQPKAPEPPKSEVDPSRGMPDSVAREHLRFLGVADAPLDRMQGYGIGADLARKLVSRFAGALVEAMLEALEQGQPGLRKK